MNIDWGRQVKGLDEADADIANGTLTGTINGRAFKPFDLDADPATAVFLDGKPAPRGSLPGKGMKKQIERLEAEVADVIQDCEIVTSLDEATAPLAVQALARAGGTPGHFSDTYSTLECDGCKAAVVAVGATTCVAVCVFTLGIGCPVCVGGAVVAVPAGILACEQSGACCPIACGGGFPGTCCFGDEKCLDGDGLCCSFGTETCAGKACCGSGESCIDQGTEKGKCCTDTQRCGALNCCPDGETCFDQGRGSCCATGKECGSVCCGGVEDLLSYCMNPATSTCCSRLQEECNGTCCAQGEVCEQSQCVPVDATCQQPCNDRADCPNDSHIFCEPRPEPDGPGCCVFEPF